MNAQNMQKLQKRNSSYKITILLSQASLLGLIFKNIYKVRIMYNFYVNLTWFEAWNNRFYPKATKLQNLKWGVIIHEIYMQKYSGASGGWPTMGFMQQSVADQGRR